MSHRNPLPYPDNPPRLQPEGQSSAGSDVTEAGGVRLPESLRIGAGEHERGQGEARRELEVNPWGEVLPAVLQAGHGEVLGERAGEIHPTLQAGGHQEIHPALRVGGYSEHPVEMHPALQAGHQAEPQQTGGHSGYPVEMHPALQAGHPVDAPQQTGAYSGHEVDTHPALRVGHLETHRAQQTGAHPETHPSQQTGAHPETHPSQQKGGHPAEIHPALQAGWGHPAHSEHTGLEPEHASWPGHTSQPQPPGPAPAQTPSTAESSPAPLLSANLGAGDLPFSEFSPFYHPPVFTPSPAPTTPQAAPPEAALANLEITPRRPSSSPGFEPGVDMSSFDASTTRALPGRRGMPGPGMQGWEEDDTEHDVAKTWEEELDRRAKAGAELQRRTEQLAEREREERLQAEFWEEERRLGAMPVIEGPQKPPKPELPPRQSTPPAPESWPVPMAAAPALPARQAPPSATTSIEIYQIKHITWTPPTASHSVRSPILLQSANGPCPLLALVNALILSTAGTPSALLSALQAREQVSLELLLDVVFQELMDRCSGGGGSGAFPDVSDLFAFLLTLHTGMNVNPRFYRAEPEPMTGREYADFEPTREMELYGAFRIPLVHGWLPDPDHPATAAMKRRGITNYEDAQTLLLTSEDLIMRLSTTPLGPDDHDLIADASIIRDFLDSSATQLTPHGLATVADRLAPGQVAILFRNDHFVTIIGVPRTTFLHSLITDAGFASLDDVVWEQIVDPQATGNVFLSGSFSRPPNSNSDADNNTNAANADSDADLALAMMLQDEEDERERQRAQAARREHRPVPPPPYESVSRPEVAPYQSMAASHHGRSVSAGSPALTTPAGRHTVARGLLQEIQGRAGPVQVPVPQPRRQSVAGHGQEKEKCVIC